MIELKPIEDYYRLVHWCVARYGKNIPRRHWEDLTQDCNVQLVRCYQNFSLEKKSEFSTYIIKTLAFYICDWHKRKGLQNENLSLDTKHNCDFQLSDLVADRPAADQDWSIDINLFLRCLDKQSRLFLFLHKGLNYTLREIGAMHGMTCEQVNQIIQKAMAKVHLHAKRNGLKVI
jgi:RNA polymerase sigma factor (sigma-70 family)